MARASLLVFEMRVQAADGSVGITETYAEVGRAWGTLMGVAGAVQIGAVQLEDGVTHRAVCDWIDPSAFSHVSAKGGAQRFRLRGARDPDGRQRRMEIMLEEERAEVPA